MIDNNINFTDPNMTCDLATGQFFNLCYKNSSYPNSLVVRGASGQFITSYPTNVILDYPVTTLIYNGVYFWSLQRILLGDLVQGSIIRKWSLNTSSLTLDQLYQKYFIFDGGYKYQFSSIACEYYHLTLRHSCLSGDYTVEFSYPNDLPAIKRINVGSTVILGPNNLAQTYYGTVSAINYDDTPLTGYCSITFSNPVNYSFAVGNSGFCEVNMWAFDNSSINPTLGTLHQLHPTTLGVISSTESGAFLNIQSSIFNIIEYLTRINAGQRIPALFFKGGQGVLVCDINDLSTILSNITLPYNHQNYNDPIETYALHLDHDPNDSDYNSQFYCLQTNYWDQSEGYSAFENQTYNYLTFKLDPYPVFMNLTMDHESITLSGETNCRCKITDQYNFPIPSGRDVTWITDGDGYFLGYGGFPDNNNIPTDLNGTSYNRLKGGSVKGYYKITTSVVVT